MKLIATAVVALAAISAVQGGFTCDPTSELDTLNLAGDGCVRDCMGDQETGTPNGDKQCVCKGDYEHDLNNDVCVCKLGSMKNEGSSHFKCVSSCPFGSYVADRRSVDQIFGNNPTLQYCECNAGWDLERGECVCNERIQLDGTCAPGCGLDNSYNDDGECKCNEFYTYDSTECVCDLVGPNGNCVLDTMCPDNSDDDDVTGVCMCKDDASNGEHYKPDGANGCECIVKGVNGNCQRSCGSWMNGAVLDVETNQCVCKSPFSVHPEANWKCICDLLSLDGSNCVESCTPEVEVIEPITVNDKDDLEKAQCKCDPKYTDVGGVCECNLEDVDGTCVAGCTRPGTRKNRNGDKCICKGVAGYTLNAAGDDCECTFTDFDGTCTASCDLAKSTDVDRVCVCIPGYEYKEGQCKCILRSINDECIAPNGDGVLECPYGQTEVRGRCVCDDLHVQDEKRRTGKKFCECIVTDVDGSCVASCNPLTQDSIDVGTVTSSDDTTTLKECGCKEDHVERDGVCECEVALMSGACVAKSDEGYVCPDYSKEVNNECVCDEGFATIDGADECECIDDKICGCQLPYHGSDRGSYDKKSCECIFPYVMNEAKTACLCGIDKDSVHKNKCKCKRSNRFVTPNFECVKKKKCKDDEIHAGKTKKINVGGINVKHCICEDGDVWDSYLDSCVSYED